MGVRPPILSEGDTVGIVTLGSPLDEAVINARIAFLRSLGFTVVLGKYVYSSQGIVAASAQIFALVKASQQPILQISH